MQNPQVVTPFVVPAAQPPPAAMHPAMGALHAPASGCDTGLVRPGVGLLPPPSDRRRAPVRVPPGSPLVVILALVPTPPLGGGWGGVRPCPGHARESLAGQRALLPLRAVHGQPERHATAGGE